MRFWKPELIESAFADAALDPSMWVTALDQVTEQTEAFGALLVPIAGDGIPNIPHTETIRAATESYFGDGWYLRDERNNGIPLLMRNGAFDDLEIFDFDGIKRHPYYQEFLAPHGLRWFVGVRVAAGEDIWCLSIQRTIEQGPFSPAEKQRLAQMSSRLSCSAALARALGTATATGAMEAFESSGKAVVLIDRRGDVFCTNASAEHLLTGDARIERRRLVSYDATATAALNRALHALLFQRVDSGLSHPVVFPRRGQRPVLAYPIRPSAAAANPLADCQALVVLVDLDQQPRPPESVLRTTFKMTPAEARLAALLASGLSLESATNQIGITVGTGRNQLKNIFGKTDVKRQSELVALLASLLQRPVG